MDVSISMLLLLMFTITVGFQFPRFCDTQSRSSLDYCVNF